MFCTPIESHDCTGVCASLYFYDKHGKEILYLQVDIDFFSFCLTWETQIDIVHKLLYFYDHLGKEILYLQLDIDLIRYL